jgi:hypothetical protein
MLAPATANKNAMTIQIRITTTPSELWNIT